MKFTSIIFFGAVLLLSIALYAQCFSVQGKEDHGKRMVAVTSPKDIAVTLDERILAAGFPSGSQVAFLYLNKLGGTLTFDNDEVGNNLGKVPPVLPFLNALAFWPANPKTTNFLIAKPTFPDKGDNTGHSEHKLLLQLEDMRLGFQSRNKGNCGNCPAYVILGTRLTPCYSFQVQTNRCAQDYGDYKEKFMKTCKQTRFYLYVRSRASSDNLWNVKQKYFDSKGITVFIKP